MTHCAAVGSMPGGMVAPLEGVLVAAAPVGESALEGDPRGVENPFSWSW